MGFDDDSTPPLKEGLLALFKAPSAATQLRFTKRRKASPPFLHCLTESSFGVPSYTFLSYTQQQAAEAFAADIWAMNGWSRRTDITGDKVDTSFNYQTEKVALSRHQSFQWAEKAKNALDPFTFQLIWGVCIEMWSLQQTLLFLESSSPKRATTALQQALTALERVYRPRLRHGSFFPSL